jgi:thiamine-phosphate pyrophosphorylase
MKRKQIICITNRHLVKKNFWTQLEEIAATSVDAIILREKDLSPTLYKAYAKNALEICAAHNTSCILHHFSDIAAELPVRQFHCSLYDLEEHQELAASMTTLGISIHTPDEAKKAAALGATYLMVGHVFPTACKPDTPATGIENLAQICENTTLPVYALGGINEKTLPLLHDLPIAGIVAMSGFMTCDNLSAYVQSLSQKL